MHTVRMFALRFPRLLSPLAAVAMGACAAAGSESYVAAHGGCPDLEQVVASGSEVAKSASEWAGPDVTRAVGTSPDAAHVDAVVEANVADLTRCYEDALQVWPLAAGDVVLSFVVAPDGSVAKARVDATEVPSAVACCMRESVRRWSFGALESESALLVTYPFALSSDSMRAETNCANMGAVAITTYQKGRKYCHGYVEVGPRQPRAVGLPRGAGLAWSTRF